MPNIDVYYREALKALYQDPFAIDPRILIGLQLLESYPQDALRLLRRCLQVSIRAEAPISALWSALLLKKYAPLAQIDEELQMLSQRFGLGEVTPIGLVDLPPHVLTVSGVRSIFIGEEDAELAQLKTLMGGELERQALVVASDFSAFDVDDNNLLAAPQRLPLFSAFQPTLLRQLIESMELRVFSQGDHLLEEGEEADGVYLICNGKVEVNRRTVNGDTIEIAQLRDGDLVGEMGLLTRSPRVATVTALTNVWAVMLPRVAYDIVSGDEEQLNAALVQLVGGRMLRNLVKISPLFNAIPKSAHPSILDEVVSIEAQPGDVLLEQGKSGLGLFIVLDGLIQVNQRGSIEPKWIREGDIFGEMSLIYDRPVTATCIAARRSLLFLLKPERFKQLVQEYPQVQEYLSETSFYRNLDELYTLT